MAEGAGSPNKRPERPKSILKHSQDTSTKPEVKWDEMNILETYHPANKDYGHMKINEPPTPYSYLGESDDEQLAQNEDSNLNADQLAHNLQKASPRKDWDEHQESSEEDETLSPEEKQKKRAFKDHRRKHYDEFSQVKKARELIAKELAELEDDDETTEPQKMDTSH